MTHAQDDPRTPDATDDLLTGRHRDAAGQEHDLVSEATTGPGTETGAVTDRDGDEVADAAVGPGATTGVVTDREAGTGS